MFVIPEDVAKIDPERTYNDLFRFFVFFFGALFLITAAIIDITVNSYHEGFFKISIATIFIIILLEFRHNKITSYIAVLLMSLLFLYTFSVSDFNSGGFLWILIFPMIAMFLLGLKHGTTATFFTLVASLVIMFVPNLQIYQKEFSGPFIFRFYGIYLSFYGITWFMILMRKHIRIINIRKQRLKEKNSNKLYKNIVAKKEIEEKYKVLFEDSPDAFFVLENNRFTDCNSAAVRLLGQPSRRSLLNSHPAEFSPVHQPDGAASFNKIEDIITLVHEKGQSNVEWIFKKSGTGEITTILSLNSIHSNNKKVVFCIARDITSKKQKEASLIHDYQMIKNVLESLPYAVSIQVAPDMRYIFYNKTCERILGKTAQQMLGTTPYDHYPKEEAEDVLAEERQIFSLGEKVTFKNLSSGQKNSDVMLKTTKTPLFSKSSKPLYVLKITEDISEKINLEKVLEENIIFSNLLLNSISSPIFSTDLLGRIDECNKAFIEFTNMSKDQLVGKLISDFESIRIEPVTKLSSNKLICKLSVLDKDNISHSIEMLESYSLDIEGKRSGSIYIAKEITE